MESIPPLLNQPRPFNRVRWCIHLVLITGYILAIAASAVGRTQEQRPALSGSVSGLLLVCGFELLLFGVVFGLAWLASRASADDLRLRWRGKLQPVLLGAAYSVGLRLALAIAAVVVTMALVFTRIATMESLKTFAEKNRPGVENLVDLNAMNGNPAYFWLMVTVVSFVIGGLREELWRSAFLAGMRGLWPRQFSSTRGQIFAVCIAAVIFGSAHTYMGVMAAFQTGILGLGLGLIMIHHRSIWPAALAHGFFDATSMALIPWAMEIIKTLPKH